LIFWLEVALGRELIGRVLGRPGPGFPRQKGETQLAIKETTLKGRRYVLCRNEEEIRTAANRGTTAAVSWRARAWRRQVNTRLAEIPCRRATSETFAPGASVSSTMRALSSPDHRRRRSTPLRTSTRIARP
jgi:hypothetical protein